MESLSFQAILAWVSQHSAWAGPVVFLIAFSESLAVLGLVMPGAVLLFGVGALIGADVIPLWPAMIGATIGAMAGDGISYWLGRHYKLKLRAVWPFRSYPALVTRGVDFFHRHGGKSVAMGRFVGPLRPIVPAIAGMLEMRVTRYVVINVLASIVWAPVYLLPGVAFGTSLQLASEVAGRLVLFLILALALLWITAWLLGSVWRLLAPRAYFLVQRVLLWTRGHPILGELPASLVDAEHPEARGLSMLAVLLFVSTVLFLFLARAVTGGPLLANVDQLVFHALQQLRTPWADNVMVFVTGLGDLVVLAIMFLLVTGWLAWRHHWRTLGHWVAASLVPLLMANAIKLATRIERPQAVDALAESYSFPSAHAAVSMGVYGFLAVMVAKELPYRLHMVAYILAGLCIAAISFSRLYLGAHWLSDVIGGLLLGLAWVALLGIAYRTHVTGPAPRHGHLGALALVVFSLAVVMSATIRHPENRLAYAPRYPQQTLGVASWWREEWTSLPAYRNDLWGQKDYPLQLQWMGSVFAIHETLRGLGWREPPSGGTTLLNWFRSQAMPDEIPVLPQVHRGRHEILRLVRDAEEPSRLEVLRLWPTDITLLGQGAPLPLWLGSMTRLRTAYPLGLSILRTEPGTTLPVAQLVARLNPRVWETREVERADPGAAPIVLIRPGQLP